MKKTKILIINHAGNLGGSSISFLDLISMLQTDFDLIAGIPVNSEQLQKELTIRKCTFITFDHIPVFSYHSGGLPFLTPTLISQLFNINARKKFAKEITRINPDIVFFNSMVMSLSAKFIPNSIKKIVYVRETFKYKVLDNIFKNVFNKYFQEVIFISKFDMQYCRNLKISKHVVTDVDSNFVETLDFSDKRKKRNEILFLGGFDPIKGIDVLLKSLDYLDDLNIKVIIAGNTNYKLLKNYGLISYFDIKKTYFNYVVKHYLMKYENIISIVGFIPNNSTYFDSAKLLVFPSKFQHQSRPAFEAGYRRIPIILTDFDATNLEYINEINSLTFKKNDSKQLSEKIKILFNDDKLVDKIVENNFINATENHNFTINKELLINTITDVSKSV